MNFIIDLIYDIKTSVGRHEFVAVVDNKCAYIRILVSTCFESTPNLDIHTFDAHRILITIELWPLTHLNQASFTHSFLDDDIENLTHCLAVLSIRLVDLPWIDNELSLSFDNKSDLSSFELRLDKVRLLHQLLSGPDVETRVDEFANE